MLQIAEDTVATEALEEEVLTEEEAEPYTEPAEDDVEVSAEVIRRRDFRSSIYRSQNSR